MTDKKVVFVAFAIEDERMRDLFKGQSLHPRHPYEFIDMSVKKPYDTEWKEKVSSRVNKYFGWWSGIFCSGSSSLCNVFLSSTDADT